MSRRSVRQVGIELPRAGGVPEPRDQELAVQQELLGELPVEVELQLLDRDRLTQPGIAIDFHELGEVLRAEVAQADEVEVLAAGHPAQRALDAVALAMDA